MEAALPMIPAPRTLIADDHPDVLAALRMLLRNEGWQTEAATSPAEALEAIKSRDYDVVLVDLNYARDTTSGQEGLDLIARIRALDSALPVVAMTAWANIELAVEAMRRGVADFIQKPWENARLLRVLRDQIAAGRARRIEQRLIATRDRELAAAEEIQQSLLPRHIPIIEGAELAVAWRPAGVVSGDYFDVIQFDENRAAMLIGDVMGKGMPAALVMSNLQALVKAFATAETPPQRLCEQINRAVCGNLPEGRYITFFYGLFETASRQFIYANAGHNPPLLVRRDGRTARLSEGGIVLGLFPEIRYEQGQVGLRAGDRLLFFTDGITEAANNAGELFGEERLLRLLVEHRGRNASELRETILNAVADFSGGSFQDDVTLISFAVEYC
ncbi:MAG TPA: SpoIIE family protein phosphatase [Blastocatellia bacterium]|nr:SpoIIE family protein phosphatase [Blastocatellia bacterium]